MQKRKILTKVQTDIPYKLFQISKALCTVRGYDNVYTASKRCDQQKTSYYNSTKWSILQIYIGVLKSLHANFFQVTKKLAKNKNKNKKNTCKPNTAQLKESLSQLK